jgi:hypothetical protein
MSIIYAYIKFSCYEYFMFMCYLLVYYYIYTEYEYYEKQLHNSFFPSFLYSPYLMYSFILPP